MRENRLCLHCQQPIPIDRKNGALYCSHSCKVKFNKAIIRSGPVTTHTCRTCQKIFPITPRQNNKWLCSPECRRARNAEHVREFHKRQPLAEALYRARTRAKILPDGNLIRFYRSNPTAPKKCESCEEHRVLEIAHKPGHQRFGAGRTTENTTWPDKVWVLCPTCHRLIDRMNYSPAELGLTT